MEVETTLETTTTSASTPADENMEVEIPQKEKKVPNKGTAGAGSTCGKQSKAFELPW